MFKLENENVSMVSRVNSQRKGLGKIPKLALTLALLASTLLGTSSALAADTPQPHNANLSILGGDLTLTIPQISPFGEVKLERSPKIVKSSFTDKFVVTDTRGTGDGWRLDVSATQFKEATPVGGFAASTSANIFPVGSLSLSPIASTARVGTGTGANPTNVMVVDSVIDDGTVTVSRAVVNTGMGEFDLTFNNASLSVVVDPTTAKVDRINYPSTSTPYESVVSWTLVSAP